MCLAIYKPAECSIPPAHIAEGFTSNPDGAGFAVAHPQKGLIISKGYFTLAAFNKAYNPYRAYPALVHFRIGTSGGINKQMCHPFPLYNTNDTQHAQYALIHNGILDVLPHDKKSDTATFADGVITPLLQHGVPFDSPALKYLVETSIGSHNKILIMSASGKVAFFNESSGNYVDGIWYSNESYTPAKLPRYTLHKPNKINWNNWRSDTLVSDIDRCECCYGPIDDLTLGEYCGECLEAYGDMLYDKYAANR